LWWRVANNPRIENPLLPIYVPGELLNPNGASVREGHPDRTFNPVPVPGVAFVPIPLLSGASMSSVQGSNPFQGISSTFDNFVCFLNATPRELQQMVRDNPALAAAYSIAFGLALGYGIGGGGS